MKIPTAAALLLACIAPLHAQQPDAEAMILDLSADAPRRVSHVEFAGSRA